MADRIPIKEEYFYVVSDSGNSYLGLPLDDTKSDYVDKEYEHLKSQILQDHEIVNKLNERIEVIQKEYDGDNHDQSLNYYGLRANKLEELKKIRDGK